MRISRLDLGSSRHDYQPTWELQRDVHDRVSNGGTSTVLMVEHESVYTAGKRTSRAERPTNGTPVVDVDRGGRITWHGPGQLVAYPIVRLAEPVDVVAYVRALEEAVIDTCQHLGLPVGRIEGRTGVWTMPEQGPSAKVCSIGVRVAKNTTMHGLAINVNPDLKAFSVITPCGIADAPVSSLAVELGRDLTLTEVADVLEPRLVARLRPLMQAPGPQLTDSRGDAAKAHVTTEPQPAPAAPKPGQRKMLRVEARNAQTPIGTKPEWIKTRATTGPEYSDMLSLVHSQGLHTVCEEAGCPNIYECWEDREATFLIGGSQCTRRCDFCQIDTGKPAPLDRAEPFKVASSVKHMGLRYATVTGVARDDLDDGGAWLYAETVRQIHALNPGTGVELLIPDFDAKPDQLAEVFSSRPEVLAHNVETVPRIFRRIRPGFRYDRSLSVLTSAHEDGFVTKSNLMLGMGETFDEVVDALRIIHQAGCDLITINQYMRPSVRHHPVERWVKPDEFVELSRIAEEIGYLGVMSGPLVRSSYRAGRLWGQAMVRRGEQVPDSLLHLTESAPARQEAISLLSSDIMGR